MPWADYSRHSDDTYIKVDGEIVGEIRDASTLKRDDYESDGTDRTWWGMEHTGIMIPSVWSNADFGSPYPYDRWKNKRNGQTQNWKRTDCGDLTNYGMDPDSDLTSSVDTTFTVSIPPTVSISIDHPKLKRDWRYDYNEWYDCQYYYVGNWGTFDGIDERCDHGMTSAWSTLRPSSGDQIAPTYYMGTLTGRDGDLNYETKANNLFKMFYYYEIDDV